MVIAIALCLNILCNLDRAAHTAYDILSISRPTTGKEWLSPDLIRKGVRLKGCDAGINLGSQQQKKVQRAMDACIYFYIINAQVKQEQCIKRVKASNKRRQSLWFSNSMSSMLTR